MSASLDFGSSVCEKRDLVIAASAAVAHLTQGGGNRVGAIIAAGNGIQRVPARGGRPHVQYLLRTLARAPRAAVGQRGDLNLAIEQLRRPPRRRGLAVIISDFIGPVDWQRSLRALSARHDLLGVEVLDPLDMALPEHRHGDVDGSGERPDPPGRDHDVAAQELRRPTTAQHRQEVSLALRRAGAAAAVAAHRPGLDRRHAAVRDEPQARLDRGHRDRSVRPAGGARGRGLVSVR